jgi:hypothetical protein
VIAADPHAAPARPDLVFLRRRSLRRAPAPHATATLDLSVTQEEAAPPALAVPPALPAEPSVPAVLRPDTRVRGGARHVLTAAAPTVTLTRTQSAIGALTIEAVLPEELSAVRLAAAYELRSGATSIVDAASRKLAPPGTRRPVLVAGSNGRPYVAVDLRQCRELRRMLVYLYAGADGPVHWAGTAVATTYSGARVEVPLENRPDSGVLSVLSIYSVDGEFVIRDETQPVTGSVREVCRAFGYDRISWRDDRTPAE